MIITRLMGGLGNQMFQYAAGRSLALRRGSDLALDLSFLREPPSDLATLRPYELGCFPIEAALLDTSPRIDQSRSWISRLFPRREAGVRLFQEQGPGFDPAVFRVPDQTLLVGYWQSELYFRDHAEVIRRDFTFCSPPTGRNEELAAEIEQSESISLHVRRGDYANDAQTQAFHGTMSTGYYREALSRIQTQGDPHVFVFSDDPEWGRVHLELPCPTTFVDHNRPDRGHEDMRLMSLCRHHIIANSSFSWWAAWLDPRAGKMVVAPSQWFRDATVDTGGLIPKTWIRI
jgi:glycosyl transferase family 11